MARGSSCCSDSNCTKPQAPGQSASSGGECRDAARPAAEGGGPATAGLSGKVTLVTGAGAGIGQGCAPLLAEQGATVVGCDIDPATAERTRKAAADRGPAAEVLAPLDMTVPADARGFADDAGERHGRTDVLVTAGAVAPHMATAAEMDFRAVVADPARRGGLGLPARTGRVAAHGGLGGGGSIVDFASVNAFRGSGTFGMVAQPPGPSPARSSTGPEHSMSARTRRPAPPWVNAPSSNRPRWWATTAPRPSGYGSSTSRPAGGLPGFDRTGPTYGTARRSPWIHLTKE
ncbi:SDR family oxidoreductase [Streptomyces sp. NPDC060053]|uniref:SDR family oxidoreductase n=1 Tax=Streptomyces sp. NPDC060053 TaxID=3347047 RepID=UPI0036C4DF03